MSNCCEYHLRRFLFCSRGHYSDNAATLLDQECRQCTAACLGHWRRWSRMVCTHMARPARFLEYFSVNELLGDVVFSPSSSTTPPTVNSVTPVDHSSGASLGVSATAAFSEPMTVFNSQLGYSLLQDPRAM